MSEITKKLMTVQNFLKAPKMQFNSFGKYKYRSCGDILEAVKPLCISESLLLTLSDEIVIVGAFNYVKSTAKVSDGVETISVSAMARESVTKKGMDDSQITGTASSYARKYALNGLFCIDDTKDSDTQDNRTPVKKKSEIIELKPDPVEVAGFKGTYTEILAKMKKDDRYLKGVTPNESPLPDAIEAAEKSGKYTDQDIVEKLVKYFNKESK